MNTYIYSIADAELKNEMTKGICNRMTNAFKPDIPIISIKSLKKFISLHEEKMKKQESKRKENKQNIKN
jgi:hypothetical protein